MTKYIKLTGLLFFITVTLTGFGLYKAQASSPYPEMKIVTSDGKPGNIEPIHFFGFVAESQNWSNNSTMEFEDGDIQYLEELSFLKRMEFSYDPLLNELIEDYRSFMRGKSRRAEQYTETEQHVIYTGMENDVDWNSPSSGQMTIAVLDKETEEEETLSVDFGGDGSYYDLIATYTDYPNLTILVRSNHLSGTPEVLVYTFDIDNPSEGLTKTTNLSEEIENSEALYIGQSFDRTERFITLQTLRQTQTGVSDFDSSYETNRYAYDTQTHEVIDVPLFEEETLLFTDNDTLYVGKDLGNTIELFVMNPDDQSLESLGSIDMATPTIGRDEGKLYNNLFNHRMTILDGKLYAYETQYTEDASRPLFQITDIETQETLFEGTIAPEDAAQDDTINIEVYEYRIDPAND